MIEKAEVIVSANRYLKEFGYAVVDAESVLVKELEVTPTVGDTYYGELRLQGIDGKVGDIELGLGDENGAWTTLKETCAEGQSKSLNVVFFNKVNILTDLRAFFTGYKLVVVKIKNT